MNELLNDYYIQNFLISFGNQKEEMIKHCLIIGIDYIQTFMGKSANLFDDLKMHSDKIKMQFEGEINTNEAIKSLKEQMNELNEKIEQKFNKKNPEAHQIDVNFNEMALTQKSSKKLLEKQNSITPKITEIPLSDLKTDQNRSIMLTRHHLNDEQIRASFQETESEQPDISHYSSQKTKLDQSQQLKESEKKPPMKPKFYKKNAVPDICLTSQSEDNFDSNYTKPISPIFDKKMTQKLSNRKQQNTTINSSYNNNQQSVTIKNSDSFVKKNRNSSQNQAEISTKWARSGQSFIGSQKYTVQNKENQKPTKSQKSKPAVPAYLRNVCSKIKTQVEKDKIKSQGRSKASDKFDFVSNENVNNQNQNCNKINYMHYQNEENFEIQNSNNYQSQSQYESNNGYNYLEQNEDEQQLQFKEDEQQLQFKEDEQQLQEYQVQQQQEELRQQEDMRQQELYLQQEVLRQQEQRLRQQNSDVNQQQQQQQQSIQNSRQNTMQSDKPCAIIENFLNSPILQFFKQSEGIKSYQIQENFNAKQKQNQYKQQQSIQSNEMQFPVSETSQRKKWNNISQKNPNEQSMNESPNENANHNQKLSQCSYDNQSLPWIQRMSVQKQTETGSLGQFSQNNFEFDEQINDEINNACDNSSTFSEMSQVEELKTFYKQNPQFGQFCQQNLEDDMASDISMTNPDTSYLQQNQYDMINSKIQQQGANSTINHKFQKQNTININNYVNSQQLF